MLFIAPCPLPEHSLLQKYASVSPSDPSYTDSYSTTTKGSFALSDYVYAFYTTALFKTERFILTHTVKKPSDDVQARQLADCETEAFAAWTVEARTHDQLLMCDFVGATRSWLMVESLSSGTRLYFGSAVVPKKTEPGGTAKRSPLMQALTPFHLVYSRALLAAAKQRIESLYGKRSK